MSRNRVRQFVRPMTKAEFFRALRGLGQLWRLDPSGMVLNLGGETPVDAVCRAVGGDPVVRRWAVLETGKVLESVYMSPAELAGELWMRESDVEDLFDVGASGRIPGAEAARDRRRMLAACGLAE